MPDAGIFDSIFEAEPFHRQIKDVWQGKGEPGDPLIPQDEHEHELVLQRLREDSDAQWGGAQETSVPAATKGCTYGTDGVQIETHQ